MSDYETKWPTLAAEVRCRKFGEQAPASYKDWARQARFLQQRGFTTEHVEFYAGELYRRVIMSGRDYFSHPAAHAKSDKQSKSNENHRN